MIFSHHMYRVLKTLRLSHKAKMGSEIANVFGVIVVIKSLAVSDFFNRTMFAAVPSRYLDNTADCVKPE